MIWAIFFLEITRIPALAQDKQMKFDLPINCELGQDCWFMNYVDVDPDTGVARDFTCNKRSYEGHKGTDIAIRSFEEVEAGVDVRAVASGTVLRLRDGEADGFRNDDEMDELRQARKECGNGIIIDHGEGWLSQYCHLKQGSISVKPEDKVRRGQNIAKVGLSGISAHPHIHLSLLHNGEHVDPFTGQKQYEGCGLETVAPLWREKTVKYEPFALYDGGFIGGRPVFSEISRGIKEPFANKDSDILSFWGVYFGAKPGDKIHMSFKDPNGEVLTSQDITQDEIKARQYYFIGKRKPQTGWTRGTYIAEMIVSRDIEGETVTRTLKKALDIF